MPVRGLRLIPTLLAVAVFVAAVPAWAAKPKPAWVIPTAALVRNGPGAEKPQTGSIPRGTKVAVLGIRDKWCHVALPGGGKGWVAEWLLEFSREKGAKLAKQVAMGSGGGKPIPAWLRASANVRAGPGMGFERYGTLPGGTKVFVTGRRDEWCRCKTPHGAGWVRRDLVEFDVAAGRKLASAATGGQEAESSGPPSAKGFVAGSDVRLRAKPSRGSPVIASLRKGQTVYVVDRKGSWYRLRVHGGAAGWILGSLVKFTPENTGGQHPAPQVASHNDFPAPTPQAHKFVDLATKKDIEIDAYAAGDGVNLRTAPALGAATKTRLRDGAHMAATGVSNHWVQVRTETGATGWVAGWMLNYCTPEACSVTDDTGDTYPVRVGWVARPELNLRSGPGMEYPELGSINLGSPIIVLERRNQWYRVALADGGVAWAAAWLVDTREQRLRRQQRLAMAASGEAAQQPGVIQQAWNAASGIGGKIVKTALGFIGYPYVHGGDDPSGFDCSGFVMYILSKFGIECSHDSRVLYTEGQPVGREELQPGDVIFFRNTYRAGISHVGIYMGGDQFVHASGRRTGVRVSSLSKAYYAERYAGARRFHD
jgi:cell wall-associated NlpC family hydrolase